MNIVFAEEKQIPIIRQIALDTWPDTFGNILSKKQIEYMLEWMYSLDSIKQQIQNGHVFVLIKNKAAYLGYASFEFNYKNENKTKIHKLYVLPNNQGKGLGSFLMNFIGQKALEKQNSALILNVNRFNKSVQYYHKIGFKTVKQENIDIGNGFVMEDFVMEKNL